MNQSHCIFYFPNRSVNLFVLFVLILHFLLQRPAAWELVLVVILLPFHASVLKPVFNLSLSEGNCVRHLNPALAGQVRVEQKFLLKFQGLEATINLSSSPLSCGC